MRKLILLITCFCVILCLTCLGGCGSDTSVESGSEGTGSDSAAADSSAWKAAYLEVLESDEQGIREYTFEENEGLTAMADINDDGVPELLYFLKDEEHDFPYMKIWTFRDGTASEVSYQKPLPCDDFGFDAPEDAMYDYTVEGGTSYIVYTGNDGKLYMYSRLAAIDFIGMMNQYSFDGSSLKELQRFGFTRVYDRSDMDEMTEGPADTTITYWKDGAEISEDEYDSLCVSATTEEGIKDLIFLPNAAYQPEEDEVIWETFIGQAPISVSYDEMALKLSE